MKIIHEILKKMKILKPQRKFIENLLTTVLFMGGRMNFRNLSRYSDYHEKTFSRQFDKSFDHLQFNCLVANDIITPNGRYAIGYDPFFIPKSGKHSYGKESFWNGSNQKSEKGLEGNGFALIDVSNNTAYPLFVEQTPLRNDIQKLLNFPEATRMDFYTLCVKNILFRLKENYLQVIVKHVVVDAYFANFKFVSMVQESGYHAISKLRCDANLRSLNFEKKEGRGRPKLYGSKINVQDLSNFTFVRAIDPNQDLYEGLFYSINLKRTIKVICVVQKKHQNRAFVLIFSTDLTLSAQAILDHYKARFQIEFTFRDGKQFVGLTEFQARSKIKIHNHLNTSMTGLLLAKVQEAKARVNFEGRALFSMESFKRKNYNENLAKRIISNLGFDPSLIKFHPGLQSTIGLGVIKC